MGDVRADARGPRGSASTGKRVARHAAEQSLSRPYVGRRVARPALVPAPELVHAGADAQPVAPYVGRRVARVVPEPPRVEDVIPAAPQPPVAPAVRPAPIELLDWGADPLGLDRSAPCAEEPPPVVAAFVEPTVLAPVALQPALPEPELFEPEVCLAPAVQRAIAPIAESLVEPVNEPVIEPVFGRTTEWVPPPPVAEPLLEPLLEPYGGRRIAASAPPPPSVPAETFAEPDEPVVAAPIEPPAPRSPRSDQASGRRMASRRSRRGRLPSLPLLAGVAVLAVSAGGALQAVSPNFAGSADAHRLAPASAMSGTSAVGSANLLGGRGTVVSRDSDRLQAAADAQVKQRDAALSAFAAKAEKQAAQIKLHQWVLPITPGVYHLTARFGDYSSLWSHFHTGLDFAADTGTPIMAVAGGTITEVGYSGAYGNRTIETLPDGTELWYCHQNAFGTSVGATVKPGEVIGYVGSTGNVTGPHLHLEVHPGGGDPVDPYTALVVHGLQP